MTNPLSGQARDLTSISHGHPDGGHDKGPGWPMVLGFCLVFGLAVSALAYFGNGNLVPLMVPIGFVALWYLFKHAGRKTR